MQLAVNVDEQCKVPCRIPGLTATQTEAFRYHIQYGFNITLCAGPRSFALPCALPESVQDSLCHPPHAGQQPNGRCGRAVVLHGRHLEEWPHAVSSMLAQFPLEITFYDRVIPIGRLLVRIVDST